MFESNVLKGSDRRQFLRCALAGSALACLGCPTLSAAGAAEEEAAAAAPPHKFLARAEMTYAEIFQTFCVEMFIPTMKQMAEALGRDKLIALLQDATARASAQQVAEWARKQPKRDLETWIADFRNPTPFRQHVLTFQFVVDTPTAVEFKITECLWAKTFREAGAADIGYASLCYGDVGGVPAFNPKMRFVRTQTLMQGQPYCNHRYVLEA